MQLHPSSDERVTTRIVSGFRSKTFLCSDVVASTETMERLGDEAMLGVMQRHDLIVRRRSREHAGEELELRGDGFVLAFDDPEEAVRCAAAIQLDLACDRREHPGRGVEVRIGLHRGAVLRDGRRYFGKDVVLAFRLAAIARASEIVLSDAVVRRVRERYGDHVQDGRSVALKGFRNDVRVVTLVWHGGEAGPHLPPGPRASHPSQWPWRRRRS